MMAFHIPMIYLFIYFLIDHLKARELKLLLEGTGILSGVISTISSLMLSLLIFRNCTLFQH